MERDLLAPLKLSDPGLLLPGRWERRLVWIPIIGWIAGFQMQVARVRRAIVEVDSKLRQRELFPSDAWSEAGVDPEHAEVVARVLAERLTQRLANHHFLPKDPLYLLLLDEEGLGWLEAMHLLRKHCQFETTKETRSGLTSGSTTFGDLVRSVERRRAD